MPKKPENRPTPSLPIRAQQRRQEPARRPDRQADVQSPPAPCRRSMTMPTMIITSPNRASSFWPSRALATPAPAKAPRTPAAANTAAQRPFTLLSRQCASRFRARSPRQRRHWCRWPRGARPRRRRKPGAALQGSSRRHRPGPAPGPRSRPTHGQETRHEISSIVGHSCGPAPESDLRPVGWHEAEDPHANDHGGNEGEYLPRAEGQPDKRRPGHRPTRPQPMPNRAAPPIRRGSSRAGSGSPAGREHGHAATSGER